jgi:NADH:ubiquinone oxidoreductase subunit H
VIERRPADVVPRTGRDVTANTKRSTSIYVVAAAIAAIPSFVAAVVVPLGRNGSIVLAVISRGIPLIVPLSIPLIGPLARMAPRVALILTSVSILVIALSALRHRSADANRERQCANRNKSFM